MKNCLYLNDDEFAIIKNQDTGIRIEGKAIDELFYYRKLKQEGLLVKLPCKAGDTVYFPIGKRIDGACITYINCNREGLNFDAEVIESSIPTEDAYYGHSFQLYEIGLTVFLTRQEAEKALERKKLK